MLDARGHGRSDGPVDGYDQERLTADVVALLAALALDRPVVWGYSNGAATAAQVAAVPDLVRAVIVEDPPWREQPPAATAGQEPWPGYAAWRNNWIAWHRALAGQDFAARLAASQPFLPPGSDTWPREEIILFLEAQAQFDLAVLDYFPALPPPVPWRDTVARIRCPLLLLASDPQRGGTITPPLAEEIVASGAHRRHIAFAGASHFLHHELPDPQFGEMMAAVRAFLAGVCTRAMAMHNAYQQETRRTIVEHLPLFLQIRRRHWTGLQTFLDQSHLTRSTFSLLRALEEETAPEQTLTLHQMQAALFNPYATRFPWVGQLPLLVERGYLQQRGEDYWVAEMGRTLVNQIEGAARDYMGSLQLSPSIPLSALAAMLVELVHRAWQAPEPASKTHQARTQRRLPVEGSPPLVQVEWAILGLWEARDDAHMAAWRAYRFSGPVVDILSRLWSKEAQTLPGLKTVLEESQWPADIEQGVQHLTQLGCVKVSGDYVQLTEQGQRIRDHIEAETNRIFFAPWEGMADDKVIWLAEQLTAICSFFSILSR
jgi:N-formylmaleamate deformylase